MRIFLSAINKLPFFLLSCFLCLFFSCTPRGTTSYFSQKMMDLPSTAPSDVRIYEADEMEGEQHFLRIGYVYTPPFDGEAGERERTILKRAAARMGAHGVYELETLDAHNYTYAGDPHTPFPSFRHIRKDQYVLRGTAIRFLSNENE